MFSLLGSTNISVVLVRIWYSLEPGADGSFCQGLSPAVCLSVSAKHFSPTFPVVGCPGLLRASCHEVREVLFPQRPWAWTVSGGCLLLLCVASPEAPEELCKYLCRAVGGSRVDSGLGFWGGGLEQQEGLLSVLGGG